MSTARRWVSRGRLDHPIDGADLARSMKFLGFHCEYAVRDPGCSVLSLGVVESRNMRTDAEHERHMWASRMRSCRSVSKTPYKGDQEEAADERLVLRKSPTPLLPTIIILLVRLKKALRPCREWGYESEMRASWRTLWAESMQDVKWCTGDRSHDQLLMGLSFS
jgi:hypothetical protein